MVEKIKKESKNILEENILKLKQIFPNVFSEEKIDFKKLKETLGTFIDSTNENYTFSWSGKTDSKKNTQITSQQATLIPNKKDSINFEDTKNIFIEGENLEVLKLLQKSYDGKIKMIYIDPPYNTGNDFIYKDDFSNNIKLYLEQTGQKKNSVTLTTNPATSGRFHSDWLSFMYPRLTLAWNLLKEDGVIFVSIDDNESHNLRLLMDEIFGEANYLVSLYVQVRYEGKTLVEDSDFHKLIETVHVYGKSSKSKLNKKIMNYSDEKFIWKIKEIKKPVTVEAGGKKIDIFKLGDYEIIKDTPSKHNLKEIWASGKILDGNSSGRFFRDFLVPRQKIDAVGTLYKVYGIGDDIYDHRYFTGPKKQSATKGIYYQGVPQNIFENITEHNKSLPIENFLNFSDAFGNCRLEGGVDFRSGRKPVAFVTHLLELGLSSDDDIVLDFFGGSGTTAHSIVELNKKDKGNRKFILVQLPEIIKGNIAGNNADCESISDITKKRIQNIIKDIENDELTNEKQIDLGFKVFKLVKSNYKIWEDVKDETTLKEQLKLFEDPLIENYEDLDVLYEIIIKEGYSLNSKIEELANKPNKIYKVSDDEFFFYVTLAKKLDEKSLQSLNLEQNTMFMCLDSALDDSQKTNLDKQCKLKVI